MFYSLINRENGHVARIRQTPIVIERLQAAQDGRWPIRRKPDAIDKIRARKLKLLFTNRRRRVVEQRIRLFTKRLTNAFERISHISTLFETRHFIGRTSTLMCGGAPRDAHEGDLSLSIPNLT